MIIVAVTAQTHSLTSSVYVYGIQGAVCRTIKFFAQAKMASFEWNVWLYNAANLYRLFNIVSFWLPHRIFIRQLMHARVCHHQFQRCWCHTQCHCIDKHWGNTGNYIEMVQHIQALVRWKLALSLSFPLSLSVSAFARPNKYTTHKQIPVFMSNQLKLRFFWNYFHLFSCT